MSEPLVLIDSSEIRPGKLEEVKAGLRELVDFVEANEPLQLAYAMSLNKEGTRMTVVQIHPDSASVELHMKVAAPIFARFADLIKLWTMDVYGTPSPGLLQQLEQKVRLLRSATIGELDLHAGFTRFRAARESLV
jgi:quinol monooxygenase YgiN